MANIAVVIGVNFEHEDVFYQFIHVDDEHDALSKADWFIHALRDDWPGYDFHKFGDEVARKLYAKRHVAQLTGK